MVSKGHSSNKHKETTMSIVGFHLSSKNKKKINPTTPTGTPNEKLNNKPAIVVIAIRRHE